MTTPTDQELEKACQTARLRINNEIVALNVEQYQKVSEIILSALKQVQPTKGLSVGKSTVEVLVDSIAVSPQEQISADAQNVSTDVREAGEDSSDRRTPIEWNRVLGRGIIDWDGFEGVKTTDLMTQGEFEARAIHSTQRCVPPPASALANPPKEGRASAENYDTPRARAE